MKSIVLKNIQCRQDLSSLENLLVGEIIATVKLIVTIKIYRAGKITIEIKFDIYQKIIHPDDVENLHCQTYCLSRLSLELFHHTHTSLQMW